MERASLTASISKSLGLVVFLFSLAAVAQTVPPTSADCQSNPACAKDLEAGVNDYQQHRYDTALASFQRAFAQSSDARVLVLMGRTYFKRGDSRGALELYERAQPQITNAADRIKLEQYIVEARGENAVPANLALRADAAANPARADLTTSPPAEKKLKPWAWALIGISAAAVVGTAVGLGVYFGSAKSGPDTTVHFP